MVIGTSFNVTAEDEGMMQFVLDAFVGANKLVDSAAFPENIVSFSSGQRCHEPGMPQPYARTSKAWLACKNSYARRVSHRLANVPVWLPLFCSGVIGMTSLYVRGVLSHSRSSCMSVFVLCRIWQIWVKW